MKHSRESARPEEASVERSYAHTTEPEPLAFSVIICTCNRGSSIVRTIRSIFAVDVSCKELIIVDQSDTDETQAALADWLGDPRLRYVRTPVKGKAQALNHGLQIANCNIVAITDDDIEVLPTWPQYHLNVLRQHPEVVMTYGGVWPISYDHSKGFIPVYEIYRDRLVTNMLQKLPARGIGANTALRRDAILALGGYDPALGPGARFRAAEDYDMTMRCILSGHHVYEVHESQVYHSGFRNWDQARTLVCNSFYGMGALHIKAIKGGHCAAIVPMVWEFTVHALFPSLWNTLLWQHPTGWKRVCCFLHGAWDGGRVGVDKQQVLFKL